MKTEACPCCGEGAYLVTSELTIYYCGKVVNHPPSQPIQEAQPEKIEERIEERGEVK